VEELADAILLASTGPRRACLLAARVPRDNVRGAPTTTHEPLSRGGTADTGVGTVMTVGVAARSLAAGADAPWLFREMDVVVAAVGSAGEDAGTFGGGVDERNDFWRNTPGEHDGNMSGEIFLKDKLTWQRSAVLFALILKARANFTCIILSYSRAKEM